uniref:Retrovirus-related Pol polyprotein LINE-1 n=1 Tax=Cajanus cajan TaxID=3821 RepID=A0A151TK44_CAJCA|nr:Retrovirus-related Pol polyprotein LINE-1 [Cajanus cajan]
MLKIDKLTSIETRGRFARICVEIDLKKKLVSHINVLGHILHLEYEGLHSICFHCGKYGHKQTLCTELMVKEVDETNPNQDRQDSNQDQSNLGCLDSVDQYGPWMIVKRNNKTARNRPQNLGKDKARDLGLDNRTKDQHEYISGERTNPVNQSDQIAHRIKLDKSFMVDAYGHAGGIWCFWDSARWKLEMLQSSSQFVHFVVSSGSLAWELTVVYVNPHPQFRIGLWRDLRRIAANIQNPWCILGDFNVVLKESERKGGSSSACLRGDNAFREEELLWLQKSRCKWMEYGDRNTSYFHGTIVNRRRQNRIVKLQDDEGTSIENKRDLELMVTAFYKRLFKDPEVYVPYCLTSTFPALSAQELEAFSLPFSDLEIHGAVKQMGGLKAPGPDGFQAIFYQSQWNIVGPSLCRLIHDVELNPRKISEINGTLITLITKVDNVVSLKQMRPISLCNVSYKVITKILAT